MGVLHDANVRLTAENAQLQRDLAAAQRERIDLEAFNKLFAECGLPECANCANQDEVLRTVRFLFEHISSIRRKLVAVKRALSEERIAEVPTNDPDDDGTHGGDGDAWG